MTGHNRAMGWFSKLRKRLKKLLFEYGWVAAVVWFTIFGLTLCGFAFALSNGLEAEAASAMMGTFYDFLGTLGINVSPSGAAETTGVWALAYGLTQLTKPLRILVTIILTPIVAPWVGNTPSKASEE